MCSSDLDWWRELRKQEREIERYQAAAKLRLVREHSQTQDFESYLQTEVRDEFLKTVAQMTAELERGGQSLTEARQHAEEVSRLHFQNRFRRQRPSIIADDGPVSLHAYLHLSE